MLNNNKNKGDVPKIGGFQKAKLPTEKYEPQVKLNKKFQGPDKKKVNLRNLPRNNKNSEPKRKKKGFFSIFKNLKIFGNTQKKNALKVKLNNPRKKKKEETKEVEKEEAEREKEKKGEAIEVGEVKTKGVPKKEETKKAKEEKKEEIKNKGVPKTGETKEVKAGKIPDALTEERKKKKSIEVVSLLDASSDYHSSSDEKGGNREKNVYSRKMSITSSKTDKSEIPLKGNDTNSKKEKDQVLKDSELSKEKNKVSSSDPADKNLSEKESKIFEKSKSIIMKKKSSLKDILKVPLTYASKSFLTDFVLKKKESFKGKDDRKEGPEGKEAKQSPESEEDDKRKRENGDKHDNDEHDEDDGSETSSIIKKIEKFNFLSEKNSDGNGAKSPPKVIFKSKFKIKKKKNGSNDADTSNSTSSKNVGSNPSGLNVTIEDIKVKKNNLVERATLIAKEQITVPKEMLNEENEHHTHHLGTRRATKTEQIDEVISTKMPFNIEPPPLFCENAFVISPLVPVEDIIDMIYAICNKSKEDTIAKLKLCKENNQRSSTVLKITLDALNGSEDSVVSNLNKNMTLQKEYLRQVDHVVASVGDD
ncbi:conserved Plasmodium protein, unknown function [Plasmodium ovale wallikeri]|uniref:Uncharacterized protein n=2 Tax=Plasmodium ovale TaxID=36330 RepID=A0A1A8YQM7_PLAOA|nr:conserved Plasmodium protein, unknown function [Plasmodium ovale wallikeri]SBT33919.1 conserved Plasmodium protein, unknown function [Plasmodium ovale wallikeri]SBT76380.1 conserved Plasmodium protein, unknown function [Plasmodium ovale]